MSRGIPEGISRRELLRQGALLGGSGLFLSTLGAPWSRLLAATQACPDTLPGRYLQIVLSGGWDSSLATDPVVGSNFNNP